MKIIFLSIFISLNLFAQSPLLTLFDSGIVYAVNDNFSDGNYTGWTVQSGAYAVSASADGGYGASDKYLQCSTAGIVRIPCTQAYGTWEFDIYKADASAIFINYITNNTSLYPAPNAYMFYVGAGEDIYTFLTNGSAATLTRSSASYVTHSTWYRIKITRTSAGVFTLYIKGGTFGDAYILINVAVTGTNPFTNTTHTVSNYFLCDLDAGDRITNIRIYP